MIKTSLVKYVSLLLLLLTVSLSAQTANKVLQETFLGGGAKLENIDWSQTPDSTSLIDSFETGINTADNYGVRLTAEVTIPSDGNYTFHIASDDQGELKLSVSNTVNTLINVATVDGYVSSYNWTASLAQKSQTYSFTAGDKILLSARMKEAGGSDHLQIGWSIDGAAIVVIPGSACEAPAAGPVFEQEVVVGTVLFEKWNNTTGDLGDFDYTTTPDETSNIPAFDIGENIGDNYNSRMTAVLSVPATGSYVFYVASDDDSQLFVSTDGIIANATMVASVSDWVSPLDWTKNASQQSITYSLTAGQEVAIQLIHRDGNNLDHATVGWSINGGPIKIIQGIYDPYLTNDDLTISTAVTSQVSPAWLEGRVGILDNTVAVTVDGGTAFDANAMGDTKFYANNSASALGITLNPTAAIAVNVSNGANSVSQSITWTPTDIATGGSILIRKGDSLLLTANGTGTNLEIDPDWDSSTFTAAHTGAPAENFVQQFNTPGTFLIQAKIDGVIVGTFTVSVADVNLNGEIACEINYKREKLVTIDGVISEEISFSSSYGDNLEISLKEISAGGTFVYIEPVNINNDCLIARLGLNGPVIAVQEVEEFDLTTQATNYVGVIETFPDGSKLIKTNLIMLPKILGIQVDLHVFVAGVFFDDGTLDKTIMTDDFDNSSPALYEYRMIKNANVTVGACHTIKIYQNNVQIGD